jgi:hypothetical protein
VSKLLNAQKENGMAKQKMTKNKVMKKATKKAAKRTKHSAAMMKKAGRNNCDIC